MGEEWHSLPMEEVLFLTLNCHKGTLPGHIKPNLSDNSIQGLNFPIYLSLFISPCLLSSILETCACLIAVIIGNSPRICKY